MLMHYKLFTVYFVSYTYMSDCLIIKHIGCILVFIVYCFFCFSLSLGNE